jgi:hypothetical protein
MNLEQISTLVESLHTRSDCQEHHKCHGQHDVTVP